MMPGIALHSRLLARVGRAGAAVLFVAVGGLAAAVVAYTAGEEIWSISQHRAARRHDALALEVALQRLRQHAQAAGGAEQVNATLADDLAEVDGMAARMAGSHDPSVLDLYQASEQLRATVQAMAARRDTGPSASLAAFAGDGEVALLLDDLNRHAVQMTEVGYLQARLASPEFDDVLARTMSWLRRLAVGLVAWLALGVALAWTACRRTSAVGGQHDEGAAAGAAQRRAFAEISHELRTPLNAVIGYAQILRLQGALTESQARYVEVIEKSGRHMLSLTGDVLDLAKHGAGRVALEPSELALADAAGEVCDLVRPKADEAGVLLQLDLSAGLPVAVLADGRRLKQVLLNLLANAVRFTERGSVVLSVQLLPQHSADRVALRFAVSDTGAGIPADRLEAVFQPFEQAGSARLRAGGTGLGLAISREVVRLMGGDIHVESEPGRGSRFWFDVSVPVPDGGRCDDASRAPPLSMALR